VTFKWADYHSLSQKLVAAPPDGLDEAAFRCAISRSYYAAFCTARDWAQEHDKLRLTRSAADHGDVERHFRFSNDRERQKVGNWLKRLYNSRATADYDTNEAINASLAAATVQEAKNVLDKLPALPDNE
jgi:uncharacterized protein (UPF0332 family)